MDTKIFSQDGKEDGKINLPESVFSVKWNPDLVHEVVVSMQSNARAGTAHTKDRSEVRGGGRKPWKQKGTGRARHGSRRSPIWSGGGVTFGPRSDKDYSKKINKNVKAKVLAITLSKKLAEDEMIFVDKLVFESPKTASAKTTIKALSTATGIKELVTKRKNNAIIVLATRDENTEKSFANFGNMEVMQAKDISTVDILTYKYILVVDPSVSVDTLVARATKKGVKTNT